MAGVLLKMIALHRLTLWVMVISVSIAIWIQPVHTLEDEIYYLEHILPERNRKDNLLADYGIVVKGTDTVIGSVDFNHRHDDDVLEIGYTLHPDYWGQGYVSRSRACFD